MIKFIHPVLIIGTLNNKCDLLKTVSKAQQKSHSISIFHSVSIKKVYLKQPLQNLPNQGTPFQYLDKQKDENQGRIMLQIYSSAIHRLQIEIGSRKNGRITKA